MKFSAKIVAGRGRGRALGFPTLNFAIPKNFKLPTGVFVCRVSFPLEKITHIGVLFFGARETFGLKTNSLEVHLLDQKIAQPPPRAEVVVGQKIRDVRKFATDTELTAAIKKDCATARRVLSAA